MNDGSQVQPSFHDDPCVARTFALMSVNYRYKIA
jgi:hypothetical protein